jgi:hypothetical protein
MPIIPVDQKFHTLNASTPTKDRGSAQTDGLREIYTMQDIIDSVTTWEDAPSPVGIDLALITRTSAYSIAGDRIDTVKGTTGWYYLPENRIPSPPRPS